MINCESSRKKYKIKRKKNTFLVNTKYISSRELKTSKFSFVLRTHENSDVFNTLDEIYWYSPQKSKLSSTFIVFMSIAKITV